MKQSVKYLLDEIYARYHKPEYINPDPLVFVRKYSKLKDREIAGLIASSLALGKVNLIMNAVDTVLSKFGSLFSDVKSLRYEDFEKIFTGFTYRFFKTSHIAGYLSGINFIINKYGSVGDCFKKKYKTEKSYIEAIHSFNRELLENCKSNPGILVTESWKGSPFKRFNLFLRWMARNDEIDPGGWDFIDKSKLIVPLDTHMSQIGTYLGFTSRPSSSLKKAIEITESLKKYDALDPVRFDFSLTRLGIHPDLSIENLKNLELHN
ncbi:MAG: TIGR02757 family protein [Spirochaetes bacterium]|nr:TIGR02757 family protein [Spirochaetota bacterium]